MVRSNYSAYSCVFKILMASRYGLLSLHFAWQTFWHIFVPTKFFGTLFLPATQKVGFFCSSDLVSFLLINKASHLKAFISIKCSTIMSDLNFNNSFEATQNPKQEINLIGEFKKTLFLFQRNCFSFEMWTNKNSSTQSILV